MPKLAPKQKKGPTLAQAKEINAFLASVERRAFKHAAYAVRDDDAALDIVQDSMMKLTESYADKPAAELPMLFTRILQNTILDYFRRTKTRNQYVTNFSSLGGAEADDDFDVLEILESQDSAVGKDQPLAALEQGQAMGAIEEALRWDIINGAAPAGELDAMLDSIVGKLMLGAPNAFAIGKRALFDILDLKREAAMAYAETAIGGLGQSAEAAEGRAAFGEKRKPAWTVISSQRT
jgi:RNA polymerase sigma-70 factor (ECF subfamily)